MSAKEEFAISYLITTALDLPFPDNLVALMKARKKSNEKLAEDLDISYAAVSDYRTGNSKPDLPMAVCITKCLALNLKEAQKFLESLNYSIAGNEKSTYAYRYMIEHCKGQNAQECNQFLKECGLAGNYLIHAKTRPINNK